MSVRVFYRCTHLEKLEEIHLVTLAYLWPEFEYANTISISRLEFIPEVCYTKNGTRGEGSRCLHMSQVYVLHLETGNSLAER